MGQLMGLPDYPREITCPLTVLRSPRTDFLAGRIVAGVFCIAPNGLVILARVLLVSAL